MKPASRRPIAIWLFVCSAMVFATLVVGGVTRLTHSGLSIVEWQPLVGTLPPLSQADWLEVFEKYKQTPEFQKVNHSMSLEEFKGIFWWEYFHRVLGRGIGVVFLLPFLYFLLRGHIERALVPKLVGIFILGGLQGAMGWYMVKSGLVDDPRVSQYRLTAHLSLAFVIFIAMMWVALDLIEERSRYFAHEGYRRLQRFGFWLFMLACYMVVTGGFVAGIRAGKAYNTFPLMNGSVIPPEYFMLTPWWDNFLHNMATVQFNHRLIAWALFFLVPVLWWRAQRAGVRGGLRLPLDLMCVMLLVQLGLGIATLLLHVPVALGTAHQAGALVLFALALWSAHALRRRAAMGSMRRI